MFIGRVLAAPITLLVTMGAFAQTEQLTPEQTEFFESKIRPVLVKNCYMCHSRQSKSAQGGFVLDSKDGMHRGGATGPALVPGKPDESLLIQLIGYEGKLKMPPMGKLPDEAIADLTKWVAMGAPDPRTGGGAATYSKIDLEKGRQFWAFQPPKAPETPTVKNKLWARGEIDRLLLSAMERKGVVPVADADRPAWIRRVTFDLTGLPPSPADVDAFVKDKSKNAQAKVVDRLLASPAFGERWGRHWLDVARYAESMGRTRNQPFPYAWRYRDWVIDAFNSDKPYDRFVAEQIAGDLLPADNTGDKNRNLIATGFLALGAHDLNEADRRQYEMDVIDEMINATSRAFMAVTVGCARCHDHKFDPIPTKDYYALAGIFRSTQLQSGLRSRPPFNSSYYTQSLLLPLGEVEPYASGDPVAIEAKRAELMKQLQEAERGRRRDEVRRIARQLADLPVPRNYAMGVKDAGRAVDCEVNLRGDPHSLGEKVNRGFVQVVYPAGASLPSIGPDESGRLQLAQWLASSENPLTARVMANRVWHHLFGRGIVETVDNFGLSGSKPDNQALLDYLAMRFMDQGWSVKKLIREVALSRAYALSSNHHAKNFLADPDNRLVWRMNRRRLEVEAIRDAILAVSGQLDSTRPEGSPVLEWPSAEVNRGGGKVATWELKENYRSVYVPVIRNAPSRFFESFDFPEPSETKGRRDVTTVAPQALFLMNSPFVADQARIAAERALAKAKTDTERVRLAYRQTLSREPAKVELAQALAYIQESVKSDSRADASPGVKTQDAWARFYQVLFASAEFRYRT
jgi:cytochrome c553